MRATTDYFAMYKDDIQNIHISSLTENEEKELARRVEEGDGAARKQFIEANLPLVITVMHEFLYKHKRDFLKKERIADFLDILQEANLGLIKAVEKFDRTRGTRFSDFAPWWIREAIIDVLYYKTKVIRIAEEMLWKVFRYQRLKKSLWRKLSREPDSDDMALEMKLKVKKVKRVVAAARLVTVQSLPERMMDRRTEEFHLEMDYELLRELLLSIVTQLDENQKEIIVVKFGLEDGHPLSGTQIAQKMGIPRYRVYDVALKAMSSLRENGRITPLVCHL